MQFENLSDSINLLYTELLQKCFDQGPVLPAVSFVKKTIKGKKYWYSQVMIGGIKKQRYVGPDTLEINNQIKQAKQTNVERERLVAMLTQGGALTPTAIVGRIIENLAYSGIFSAGGLLGGSHAFTVYGNMLGVNWSSALTRTGDIDIMGTTDPVQVGIEDVEKVWETDMIPLPNLTSNKPSTKFRSIADKEVTLEFLTPEKQGKPSEGPVFVKQFHTYAEPIKYLQFLFISIQNAVIIARSGIPVNVPDPAHFAIHKLAVAVRRPAAFEAKRKKDIAQASVLLDVLSQNRPGDIRIAWEDACNKMPKRFKSFIRKGFKLLNKECQNKIINLMKGIK